MEGTSPEAASSYQHDLYALGMSPIGAAPIPDKVPTTEYVPQFSVEEKHGHQHVDGDGHGPQHVAGDGPKTVSFQVPTSPCLSNYFVFGIFNTSFTILMHPVENFFKPNLTRVYMHISLPVIKDSPLIYVSIYAL